MRRISLLSIMALVVTLAGACGDDDDRAAPGADGGPGTGNDGSSPSGDGAAPPGDEGGSKDTGTPAPPSKVNTTAETIDVDGNTRTYQLSVPKTYTASRAYPLIIALHGDGGTGAGLLAYVKLDAQTGDDAIIAYPDGSEDIFTPYDQNVDQKLPEAIIAALKARLSIDPGKIWGFGYSKGAYQLNEIACRRPGVFTAMAIHAGGAPQERDGMGNVNCPSAVALPVFVTHGQLDDPGGGEFGADYWASLAGCQTTRSPTTPSICQAYDGCSPGKPVVFCVVPNYPHNPIYGDAAAHSWAWFTSL